MMAYSAERPFHPPKHRGNTKRVSLGLFFTVSQSPGKVAMIVIRTLGLAGQICAPDPFVRKSESEGREFQN